MLWLKLSIVQSVFCQKLHPAENKKGRNVVIINFMSLGILYDQDRIALLTQPIAKITKEH